MRNFQQARVNMVDSQIQPMGVVSGKLLEAYETVPREIFVGEAQQGCAYADGDIALGQGRYLMDAQIHARLLQALEPKDNDVVLDIGGATGYSAAILSPLVSTVIALEESEDLMAQAQKNWESLSLCNIVSFTGTLQDGVSNHAPYSAILLNGAVRGIPQTLLDQLSEQGGRLVAIVHENPKATGKAVLYKRTGTDIFSEKILFDAFVPYLPGLEPHHDFVF